MPEALKNDIDTLGLFSAPPSINVGYDRTCRPAGRSGFLLHSLLCAAKQLFTAMYLQEGIVTTSCVQEMGAVQKNILLLDFFLSSLRLTSRML